MARKLIALTVACGLLPVGQAAASVVVNLSGDHAVCDAPLTACSAKVSKERPITRTPTVLPVLDAPGNGWIRVRLPGRTLRQPTPPATGWISEENTRLATTPWHIVIWRKARRLAVFRDDRRVRRYRVVVGKPSTPTPGGEFFVEEGVRLGRGDPGAPFALALSARSSVLQEFAGGPGQIAIHGVRNIGGTPGTAVSHGCIRVPTKAMIWLAARISAGVSVTIN